MGQAQAVQSVSFVMRVKLDDEDIARRLPGRRRRRRRVFTDHVVASHVIRRVMLRTTALLNYIVPY
jgi:hypothetical protein